MNNHELQMQKRYPYLVNMDVLAAWHRMNPRAACRPPFLLRPESEQIRRHVDLCLHNMTLQEVAASCRERFGGRRGLTRCTLHAYYRDFWSKVFPRTKASGAARHRRGKIRTLEVEPRIPPFIKKLMRFSRARLIWMLVVREFGPEIAPSLDQINRYVRHVGGKRTGGGARPVEIEQCIELVTRIGRLMRFRQARLIHEILLHDFESAAPVKADTTANFIRGLGHTGD